MMNNKGLHMTPAPKTLHKPPKSKKRIAKNDSYEPTDAEQIETVNKITMARVRMLLNHPFFGNLVTRLQLVDASKWCHTLATDGKYLYFNADFIKSLSDGELIFGLAHEVGHCIYDHMSRRGDRNPAYFNMAGDYIINYQLVNHNVGERITKVQILFDAKYDDKWTTEEVYDDILDKQPICETWDQHLEGEGSGGEGEGEGEGNGDGDGKSQESVSDGKQKAEGAEADENADNEEDYPGQKGPVKHSKSERERIKDEFKEAVIQSAQQAGAGNMPKGIARLVKEMTEPKMDWRQMLRASIDSCIKNDFTFQRPSRKAWHSGIVLPGLNNDERIDIGIAIDTSGSMTDQMLKDFLGETKGIMDQYADYRVRLWSFDTETYTVHEYTPDSSEDIMDYNLEGGGGTEFMCNWEMMKENEIEPDQLIMFTDGYPYGSWGDDEYCDTLFVIHGDERIQAPFGQTVHYDRAKM